MKSSDIITRRRIAVAIFVAALMLRLLVVAVKPHMGENPGMDWVTYTGISHNLLEGKGFTLHNDSQPTTRVGPVYPGFIAAIYTVFGENTVAVRLFQVVLGALTVVILYLIISLLFSSTVAIMGSLIAVIHPEFVVLPAFLYAETLFIFLFTTGIWLTLLALKRQSLLIFAAAGCILGLGSLCRGILVPLPFFLFIAFLIMRSGWRQAFIRTFALSVCMGLTIMPWTVRNYIVAHKVIPISEGFGNEFWKGNYLPFDGRFNYKDTQIAMDKVAPGLFGAERDEKLLQVALDDMRKHPLQSAWLVVRKFGRLWFEVYDNAPIGKKRTPNRMITLILGSWHYMLLGLAALGMFVARKSVPDVAVIYASMVMISLVHMATLAVPRYRLPVMLYVCMFTAVGLYHVWRKITKQHRKFSEITS